MKVAINYRVPYNVRNFSTSWGTANFSRRVLLHGVGMSTFYKRCSSHTSNTLDERCSSQWLATIFPETHLDSSVNIIGLVRRHGLNFTVKSKYRSFRNNSSFIRSIFKNTRYALHKHRALTCGISYKLLPSCIPHQQDQARRGISLEIMAFCKCWRKQSKITLLTDGKRLHKHSMSSHRQALTENM